MRVQTANFKNLLMKQLTPMSNPTTLGKLSKKSQDRFNKDKPIYLQKRNYLKIQKKKL